MTPGIGQWVFCDKYSMLRTLAFLLLLVSNSVFAQTPFIGCTDVHEKQAYFQPTKTETLHSLGAAIAIATISKGRPTVVYDMWYVPQLHPLTQAFVYWHECAHLKLGHTHDMTELTKKYEDLSWTELDADCFSVAKIREMEVPLNHLLFALYVDLPIITEATLVNKSRITHNKTHTHTHTFEQRIGRLKYCR